MTGITPLETLKEEVLEVYKNNLDQRFKDINNLIEKQKQESMTLEKFQSEFWKITQKYQKNLVSDLEEIQMREEIESTEIDSELSIQDYKSLYFICLVCGKEKQGGEEKNNSYYGAEQIYNKSNTPGNKNESSKRASEYLLEIIQGEVEKSENSGTLEQEYIEKCTKSEHYSQKSFENIMEDYDYTSPECNMPSSNGLTGTNKAGQITNPR